MEILFIFALVPVMAFVLFRGVEWASTTRYWRDWHVHKCGHKEQYFYLYGDGKPCNKCGKKYKREDWTEKVMREKWPFIWEEAKDD